MTPIQVYHNPLDHKYKPLKSLTHNLGFSLVELLLIISILGLLSAISIPKVGDIMADVREKAVAERVVEDLNYIRNYAIAHHDTTWMVVDDTQNQYALFVGPSSGSRTLIPDPQTLASDTLDLDVDYEGVTITSVSFGGLKEVSFNYWGTPSSGGSISLDTRTITLIAETGMAHETP